MAISVDMAKYCLSSILLLVFPPSSFARSEVFETPHFLVRPDEGSVGLAGRLAQTAESKRAYILGFLGIQDDRRIEVLIASSDASMSRMVEEASGRGAQWRPVREWVTGMAFSDRKTIVLSARGNEVFHALDTFEHELAHLYLDTALRGRRVPRWFHEGFAMLLASKDVGERLKTALGAAATGSWLPIRDLVDGFPAQPPAVHLAYAQAMIFVRHLHRAAGPAGIRVLIDQVARGMPFEAAFEQIFGASVEEMWERASGEVDGGGSLLWFLTSAAVLWLVITALFLYAYARKRRQAVLKRKAWESELVRLEALRRVGTGPEEVQ